MNRVKQPTIITTDKWDAQPAKAAPVYVGRPTRIIFHHTAGHHPEISNPKDESVAEAIRYAQAIQHYHMVNNGWNDSGHNFLVCRNGVILVGRHQSYTAIKKGKMVLSAHCPGQNDQPGIEHEHYHEAEMSKEQFAASAQLCAWIIDRCKMSGANVIWPHKKFYRTSCPAELEVELPAFRVEVARILRAANPGI